MINIIVIVISLFIGLFTGFLTFSTKFRKSMIKMTHWLVHYDDEVLDAALKRQGKFMRLFCGTIVILISLFVFLQGWGFF